MTKVLDAPQKTSSPRFSEVVQVFTRIGFLGFGGPAGQIALMHRVLVEEKRWLSEERFLHALNYCMLLPGPEAQQLATYAGWMLHGTRGGIVAGTLFFLPGLVVIIALSAAYALFQDADWLSGLFFGLKAAILVIVAEAMVRLGRKALKSRFLIAVAACAFLALFLFNLPFPLVVLLAGVSGFVAARVSKAHHPQAADASVRSARAGRAGAGFSWKRFAVSAARFAFWIAVWQMPLALFWLFSAPPSLEVLHSFFSRMALVTFGGAYAVLSYVAQVAVETYGWLKPGEMLDGLALAESTPGPLVLVLSYIGFLAAFRYPMGLDPLLAGILGGTVTAWATFVPSFIWIFAGAPYVEKLRDNRVLLLALSAITAAVVGVILNLAVWFGLHVLFGKVGRIALWVGEADGRPLMSLAWPDFATLDVAALSVAALAAVMIFALKQGVGWTLVVCALAGWALRLWL